MFFRVSQKDEDVIHIDNNPPFIDKVLEYVVHHCLECGQGIAESKKHDGGFVEATRGFECCFPLITIFDADIVVSPSDIELGENLRAPESVDDI